MTQSVKKPRRYDSSLRQEQASATRRAVLTAAHDLFVEHGYPATTMAAIAARAGVSVETIYSSFASKPNLLRRVWDVTVGGDDTDVAYRDRPVILALRREPDLARRLALMAHNMRLLAERTLPFLRMLAGAAHAEPAAAEMLAEVDAQRLAGMTLMAREAGKTGQLAVSEAECRDVLWTVSRGELWQLLVVQRGWRPQRYERWLADVLVQALVDPGITSPVHGASDGP
ncbi:MAG: TetR/AcrR family transcriptional regulator [Mycobacteriales bacterium]|nr:TetR/AcrR family transcriptional regulator [Frankia sp.]